MLLEIGVDALIGNNCADFAGVIFDKGLKLEAIVSKHAEETWILNSFVGEALGLCFTF